MNIVNKIGLGSVQFGLNYGISNKSGQTTPKEVEKIFQIAFSFGINIIDTASAYGTSEEVIGKLNNNRFNVISKFMPTEGNESIKVQLEDSLKRLRLSSLYGYLAHRPLDLLKNRKVWDELLNLKASKSITKIGFSLNNPEEYYQLADAGLFPDLVQVPFNYFDTRFEKILISLKDNGCEIHTRSAFLQGLFFTDLEKLPPFFDELKPKLIFLQNHYKKELLGALLNYVLQKEYIDSVIIGIENSLQLENNIRSLENAPVLDPLNYKFPDNKILPMYWPKN